MRPFHDPVVARCPTFRRLGRPGLAEAGTANQVRQGLAAVVHLDPVVSRIRPLPFVLINMAMTADGKIATANRDVASFGSKRDLAHLLELRATADAVLCGARTADLNDISLGPGPAAYRKRRLRNGLSEFNLRVLVSGSGSVDPKARVFQRRFSPIIVLTSNATAPRRLDRLRRVADEVCMSGLKELDIPRALAWLRSKWGVKRLLCEGGGELNDALFRAGVVNELHLTICPFLFGGRLAPTIADGFGVARLAEAARFRLKRKHRVGEELFLVYEVVRSTPRTPL